MESLIVGIPIEFPCLAVRGVSFLSPAFNSRKKFGAYPGNSEIPASCQRNTKWARLSVKHDETDGIELDKETRK